MMALLELLTDEAVWWLLILGAGVVMYVILDGFDLGIGIVAPFVPAVERPLLMSTVTHVWDGNETWLVFAGVILFAAFPQAYAVVLSGLYLPVTVMLLALIFRGVAFEYRFKAERSAPWWDLSFAAGSTVAAFCQGVIVGALVQGLPAFGEAPDSLHWLTPFTIFCGLALICGYALLGACWLADKTRDKVAARQRRLGGQLVWLVGLMLAGVSLWMLASEPLVRARWLALANLPWLLPLPIIAAVALLRIRSGLADGVARAPFRWAVALFLAAFVGLVVALFPYIIPRQVTLWQALAPATTRQFLLPGVLVLVPVILGYTLYGYRVFGDRQAGEGY